MALVAHQANDCRRLLHPLQRDLPRSKTWAWRMPKEWTPGVGKLAPRSLAFTPLEIYSEYPSRCLPSFCGEKIVAKFSPTNIHCLQLEVFYAYSLDGRRKILLVPADRLLALIEDIRTLFPGAHLHSKSSLEKNGLIWRFQYHPDHYPRYVGFVNSEESFKNIVSRVQEPSFTPHYFRPAGEVRSEEKATRKFKQVYAIQFRSICAAVQVHFPAVSPVMESKAPAEQLIPGLPPPPFCVPPPSEDQTNLERIFGLRPQEITSAMLEQASWIDLRAAEESQIAAAQKHAPINIDLVPASPPRLPPILIAIDVESYERDRNKITEVGLCTIDPLDIQDTAPGRFGKNWYGAIRSRHFRIHEHLNLVNKDYVQGCPQSFDFGYSEFTSLKVIASLLDSCFKPPYSKPADPERPDIPAAATGEQQQREVIIVGHDPAGDLKWIKSLGFSPRALPHVRVHAIDTRELFSSLIGGQDLRALHVLLDYFEIPAWNLHNAGNDATLTMQALLAIVVTGASERGTPVQAERLIATKAQEDQKKARQKQNQQAAQAHKCVSASPSGGDGGANALSKSRPGQSSRRRRGRRRGRASRSGSDNSSSEGYI